ncbi:multidrug resistance-associated protein 1 [Caerostris extrusa]|uniref:ABC-type glutathione-S-conjugate transporter n=1 Tax=Caerostris extrusa TaxID=172846 RepID=A0AAV4PUF9_CAEEX|nr:multidrug resistance-associated protein 1 [Caerostris extrusa]
MYQSFYKQIKVLRSKKYVRNIGKILEVLLVTGKTSQYKSSVGVNESVLVVFHQNHSIGSNFQSITANTSLLLDRIIEFTIDDFYSWRGYFYASLIFLTDLVGRIVCNYGDYLTYVSGIKIESSIMGTIYRKNLYMSPAARKDYNSGKLMSLISVDVKRLQWFAEHLSDLLVLPIKISIIIFLMWKYIGVSTLAGVSVVVILFPVSFYVSRAGWKFSDKQMKVKDRRLKLMNEILNGIKILKLYAWEIPFAGRVSTTRNEEIKWIRFSFLCNIVSSFMFLCAPFMISLAAFATFLLIDSSNVLSPTKAFVTLTLMEQLRSGLFQFPDAIADLIQFNISIKRLRQFFCCDNKDKTVIGNCPENGEAVTMKEASFSWTSDSDCVLNNINLHVRQGQLIAIIGPVGAGKSSLLSSLLGELHKKSGSIDIVAYVPQVTWILNRSLKDNILLVKPMVGEKYNKILELCCLNPDLEILPAGDETEIGEKGVNLSGGQKLRVNLAQAVYQDKDVYLLDDPLSAVDVHVRKALFKDIIANTGLLKNKTRILVTHDVSVLSDVDLIVSMKDGAIDEMGTYNDLLNRRGSFARFVEEHSHVKVQEEEEIQDERMSVSRLNSKDSTKSNISLESGGGDQLVINAEKGSDADKQRYRLTEDEKMKVEVHRLIYINYVKQMSWPLFLGAVIGFMAYTAFQTGADIWLSKWSSDALRNETNKTSRTVWRLSIYGVLGLAQVVSSLLGNLFLIYGATRACERFHRFMLDSVLKSPMSFFDTTPAGRIINRFTTDMEILDNQLFYKIEGCLHCIFIAIACFIVIGMNTPIFLVSLIPLGMLYCFIMVLHLNTYRQIQRLESTRRSPIYSHFIESIQGVSSISAYGVEKDFIQAFEEKLDGCLVCTFNSFSCTRWLAVSLNAIGSVIIFIATILAVYNRHSLSPALVGLVVSYSLGVTDALKWFVRMYSDLENKSVSVERIDEYCHLKPEAPWDSKCEGFSDEWPQNGQISFEDYSTRYRENLDLILKEINLSIESSEKVGIIGRTGAGKSSITLSLFRIMEPTTGTIKIDDIDITKIGLHNLRSKLTIIPQDPILFTGSLRMNLDPNDEHSEDEIWASLEKSYLKTFVLNLNEALEHDIEEGGSNLSAGQRQLVCLARALLKNSKILVLDEATASVDMDTDQLIQNTIRTAFADRTVITIAHRINTVLDYDKIVVLESGHIVEVGNPTNLLENENSRFYLMNKEAGLI